jgi:hypothetical protein
MRGVLANRLRTAETPNFAAQGQSVSRKTGAEVPFTGLSFFDASRNKTRNSDPSDQQKTTRPGVIRTHDQGIMSPLL